MDCFAGALRTVTLPGSDSDAADGVSLLVATKRCALRYYDFRTGTAHGSQWMAPKADEQLASCAVLAADGMPALVCLTLLTNTLDAHEGIQAL